MEVPFVGLGEEEEEELEGSPRRGCDEDASVGMVDGASARMCC